jgi:ATP-binding cassette, subfamily B, bacterial
MAPKPSLSSGNILSAPEAGEGDAELITQTAAARVLGTKQVSPPPAEPEDDEDLENGGEGEELELDEEELEDDEDDADLVVFTAKEAAGALSTIYGFVKPYLANYKKILAFVSLGVMVETLFNVIMPLSLKFLIDDALGEEDFQALYRILGVLATAGICTSIVAV